MIQERMTKLKTTKKSSPSIEVNTAIFAGSITNFFMQFLKDNVA